MQVYLAGPLFTEAERAYLDAVAERLESSGMSCFVPHQATFEPLDAATVFAVDGDALRSAHAVVAWLDGPSIDDGTACEIGIFSELVRADPGRHIGILGLVTDWRTTRRRDAVASGLNLFVTGAIESSGRICWTVDEVVAELQVWSARVA
jgi:nucleoside 2-deoxyribosyltransferase